MICEGLQLRHYQQRAVDSVWNEWNRGVESTLCVSATGTGKAVMISAIADRMPEGSRFMYIVHRDSLARQAAAQFRKWTNKSVQIELSEHGKGRTHSGNADIVVAGVQSLRGRRGKYSRDEFEFVGTDESHRYAGNDWAEIVRYFNPMHRVGNTATPRRHDGVELIGDGCEFQTVAFQYPIDVAIEDGYIVPFKWRVERSQDIDLDSITDLSSGDLSPSSVEREMSKDPVVRHIVRKMITVADGRQGIVFCKGVNQVYAVHREFKRQGATSIAVTGKMHKGVRYYQDQDFRASRVQFSVGCEVHIEGYDHPGIAVIGNAAPTLSWVKCVQMNGRGSRTIGEPVGETPEERRLWIANSEKPCIAEGQLVLTDHGLVKIECVTIDMKVWDGCEFVSHSGVVFKGIKKVITYAGLTATPDHKVMAYGQGRGSHSEKMWKTFGDCAAEQVPISVTGNGREAIRETDCCFRGNSSECGWSEDFTSDEVRLRARESERSPFSCFAESGMPQVWRIDRSSAMAPISGIGHETEMREPSQKELQGLRWERYSVSIPDYAGVWSLDHGEPRFEAGFINRQDKSGRSLRARESSLRNSCNSDEQPTQKKHSRTGSRIFARASGGFVFTDALGANVEAENFVGCNREAMEWRDKRVWTEWPIHGKARVFDVVNSGPRNRFTVQGLLVANCTTLIDFVGNSKRHNLVLGVNVLGGEFSRDEMEESVRLVADQGREFDIKEISAQAKANVAARPKLKAGEGYEFKDRAAERRFTFENYADPFTVLGLDKSAPSRVVPEEETYGRPFSVAREFLVESKLAECEIMELCQYSIPYLRDELVRRAKQGLCTYPQARRLYNLGYDCAEMRASTAKLLIGRSRAIGDVRPPEDGPNERFLNR